MTQRTDDEIRQLLTEKLYVAVISDILDSLGYRNQAMHQRLRPVHKYYSFAGRARTMLSKNVYTADDPDPYGIEIACMDDLKPGDVIVHSTDAELRTAPWGELMSTAAVQRGAVGAVVDSNVRDVKFIEKIKFPVFAAGIRPLDSNGRSKVVDYDVAIECGGILVHPGEWIFADYDGVIAIPKEAEGEVFAKAEEKVHGENITRDELLQGKLMGEVYAKYGIL